jgi:hypothetical protein
MFCIFLYFFSFIIFSVLYAHIHSLPSKCTNRITQHRRTNTNIHSLSGIQTHDLSIQAPKTHAPNCATTVISQIELLQM